MGILLCLSCINKIISFINKVILSRLSCTVSHAFGYGLMDASAMVSKAQNWIFVPKQRICKVTILTARRTFSVQNPLEVTKEVCNKYSTDVCF